MGPHPTGGNGIEGEIELEMGGQSSKGVEWLRQRERKSAKTKMAFPARPGDAQYSQKNKRGVERGTRQKENQKKTAKKRRLRRDMGSERKRKTPREASGRISQGKKTSRLNH